MKRAFVSIVILAALCCLVSVAPCTASAGETRFGTGVTKDWKLVNEGREFDTNLISCGFYGTKAFGVMKVVISIYHREKSGDTETVLTRATVDVNPKWGIMIVPDLPLPGIGLYTFTMAIPDGEVLSSGTVTITQKKVDDKMPEQPKIDGTTVEGLFNKFKP